MHYSDTWSVFTYEKLKGNTGICIKWKGDKIGTVVYYIASPVLNYTCMTSSFTSSFLYHLLYILVHDVRDVYCTKLSHARYDIGDKAGCPLEVCWATSRSSKRDWPLYVEQLEYFLAANGISNEEKKPAVFLHAETAALVRQVSRIHPNQTT